MRAGVLCAGATNITMALDKTCQEAYAAVFSDDDPTNWCLLRQEGRTTTRGASGTRGLPELCEALKNDEVCHCLLRLEKTDDGGDSKRTKFVYLLWAGESASALKRGNVTEAR